eukprot:892984_1
MSTIHAQKQLLLTRYPHLKGIETKMDHQLKKSSIIMKELGSSVHCKDIDELIGWAIKNVLQKLCGAHLFCVIESHHWWLFTCMYCIDCYGIGTHPVGQQYGFRQFTNWSVDVLCDWTLQWYQMQPIIIRISCRMRI